MSLENITSLLPPRKASAILGVHISTLKRWDASGKIPTIRTPGGQRLYDVSKFIGASTDKQSPLTNVIYCRVSSRGQTSDLERQKSALQSRYPQHLLISDIASGLNNRRRGLQTILELAMSRNLGELVVTNRDRLSRFGFDIIEKVVRFNGGHILVLNSIGSTPKDELVEDITSILHVFSCRIYCRIYGRRRNKTINRNTEDIAKGTDTETNNLCGGGLPDGVASDESLLLRDTPAREVDGKSGGDALRCANRAGKKA